VLQLEYSVLESVYLMCVLVVFGLQLFDARALGRLLFLVVPTQVDLLLVEAAFEVQHDGFETIDEVGEVVHVVPQPGLVDVGDLLEVLLDLMRVRPKVRHDVVIVDHVLLLG